MKDLGKQLRKPHNQSRCSTRKIMDPGKILLG